MSLEQGSKVHGTRVPGQPINPEPIVLGHLCNKFTLGLRKLGNFPGSGIRNKQVSDIESGYPDIESGYPDIRI